MEKHLHIISFDVPYPPDYGGVTEVYGQIMALAKAGIKVHLHCFEYGRERSEELLKHCSEVHYYVRHTGHKGISMKLPYIVASRFNSELHDRLCMDNYPVLMQGVHCTSILLDKRFNNRNVFLRLHNVEYIYYKELARATSSFMKKVYYHRESRLLKKYEAAMASGLPILALSEKDMHHYQDVFHAENVRHLPGFLPDSEVSIVPGQGCFCLYHGNLSVPENEKAALFLLEKVFADLKIPFVITGKNPSRQLISAAKRSNHTCIVANPSEAEMNDMIQKAQINILPSFNETGIKFKILNALFKGRYCITNTAGMIGGSLNGNCIVADDAREMKKLILANYELPFTEDHIKMRSAALQKLYSNKINTETLMKWIW